MKSVKSNSCCDKELSYPRLMLHSSFNSIYLMKNKRDGTIVYVGNGSCSKLGTTCTNISPDKLSDYEGDICLTNEEK